ncbi:MAG: bifunctional folylpolyglutamate synthase/dihydrofolate synthase [Bacteroidetes bacterium CG12_big_fil_rev_8_21_14_0_65_60_17]|nr:MAG: bifunctional folylpolyglutamate synthase/dihydrofolate synthase [Bacteroidetes bacterium CG12_big_fil_rev_8_21_14_0_65_60_17]
MAGQGAAGQGGGTAPALERLFALPRYATSGNAAMKPGLGRIKALLAAMGGPERTFDTVLVAGTNGKGTTAAMTASLLGATGMRVGLHTSPHLVRVTERMRVNGREAPDEWLGAATEKFWPLFLSVDASFFEATLALSVLYFAEQEVDVAVVEVGLGGRLDATNALPARVSVITHIGLDHMELLGGTLEAIAIEKAGIAKRGQPLVVGALADKALAAAGDVARRTRAVLVRAQDVLLPSPLALPFAGSHMQQNARTALATSQAYLGYSLRTDTARRALEETALRTGLRARLETLRENPRVLVDVGHNADAVSAALDVLSDLDSGSNGLLVLGMLRDKDAEAVGRVLARWQARRPTSDQGASQTGAGWPEVWATGLGSSDAGAFTDVPNHRGQSGAELAARLKREGCHVSRTLDDVMQAVVALGLTESGQAPATAGRNILFMGSHLAAANVMAALAP